jgi:translation initiation factor 3 subunit C
MIVNDEFQASWDQPTRCLLLHNVQPTRLQALATQYAEKLQVRMVLLD